MGLHWESVNPTWTDPTWTQLNWTDLAHRSGDRRRGGVTIIKRFVHARRINFGVWSQLWNCYVSHFFFYPPDSFAFASRRCVCCWTNSNPDGRRWLSGWWSKEWWAARWRKQVHRQTEHLAIRLLYKPRIARIGASVGFLICYVKFHSFQPPSKKLPAMKVSLLDIVHKTSSLKSNWKYKKLKNYAKKERHII